MTYSRLPYCYCYFHQTTATFAMTPMRLQKRRTVSCARPSQQPRHDAKIQAPLQNAKKYCVVGLLNEQNFSPDSRSSNVSALSKLHSLNQSSFSSTERLENFNRRNVHAVCLSFRLRFPSLRCRPHLLTLHVSARNTRTRR